MSDSPTFNPQGVALCLSGGGFRATLFHLGLVEHLYLCGALDRVTYLSTVSGGSVLGALLALRWKALMDTPLPQRPAQLEAMIVKPIVGLAQADVRNRAIRRGWLNPFGWFRSRGQNLVAVLDRLLFRGAVLGDLPPPGVLRVSLNSTNLRNGKRLRFQQDTIGDYEMGYTSTGVASTRVATAVAASAAYPPVFAPIPLDLEGPFWRWKRGQEPPTERETVPGPPERRVALVDGGVYDNLGLQAARQNCRTVLVSDAGAPADLDAPFNDRIVSVSLRTVDVMMARIVALPVQQFVRDLLEDKCRGTLIRINNDVESVATRTTPGVAPLAVERILPGITREDAQRVSRIRTDFDAFTDFEVHTLRCHGRSLAATALARYLPQLGDPAPVAMSFNPNWTERERDAIDRGAQRRYASLLAFWRWG